MTSTNYERAAILQTLHPHTFNALQELVMAMSAVAKNAGKKTFFGRDKGQESYARFLRALRATIHSMVLDGVIRESTLTDEATIRLESSLLQFRSIFPNWQDAYSFADIFFGEKREDAIAVIDRLRSTP
jgi:hypothetical protein